MGWKSLQALILRAPLCGANSTSSRRELLNHIIKNKLNLHVQISKIFLQGSEAVCCKWGNLKFNQIDKGKPHLKLEYLLFCRMCNFYLNLLPKYEYFRELRQKIIGLATLTFFVGIICHCHCRAVI